MNLRRMIAAGVAAGALLASQAAFAQATPANTVGVWGQDSGTGLPCRIAPVGGSATCVLPSGLVATGTFNDAAVGSVAATTPAFAGTTGISVGGLLEVPTGVNPSGSIYAIQTDLSSLAGAPVKTGNGTNGGAQRVVVASDNTPFHIIVDSSTVAAPPLAVTSTDQSGTITTGGTFQTLLASSGTRKGCLIKNPATATEPLYVHDTAASATTANSWDIPIGGSYACGGGGIVVTGTIQIEAATTGHAFTATSQ